MGRAYLTHILTDAAGRISWSVSARRGEHPYGASITMEIPTPALILEVVDSITKKSFVKPDLGTIGCTLAEESLRFGYRRYGSGPPEDIIAHRSLLVYQVPKDSDKNEIVELAKRIAGTAYHYHYVELNCA